MSSNIKKRISSKNAKRAGITVAGLAIAGLLFAGGSGAAFTASGAGNVTGKTATLNLSLTDNGGSAGTFNLNYANLVPGQQQTQVFYVTNTGSIPATATIAKPLNLSVIPGSGTVTVKEPAELAKLKLGVDTAINPTAFADWPASVNLGTLQPGETKAVTLRVSLDAAAGNNWQNQQINTIFTVTLTQQ